MTTNTLAAPNIGVGAKVLRIGVCCWIFRAGTPRRAA